MEIERYFRTHATEKHKAFQERIIPNQQNILGTPMPAIRVKSKEILAGDWEQYLATGKTDFFEEVMLRGLVIGGLYQKKEVPLSHQLHYIAGFLPLIDNWSVCDSFCASLKIALQHPSVLWGFLLPYFQDNPPYHQRFAIVMALWYYVNQEYLPQIFPLLQSVPSSDYYVQMAVAWAVSRCYIDFPADTEKFLEHNELDFFTLQQAYQKILDSKQVDTYRKNEIRARKKEIYLAK